MLAMADTIRQCTVYKKYTIATTTGTTTRAKLA